MPFDGVDFPRSALALVLGTNWETREVFDRGALPTELGL